MANGAKSVLLCLCLQETELCLGVVKHRKEWIEDGTLRRGPGSCDGRNVIDNERGE